MLSCELLSWENSSFMGLYTSISSESRSKSKIWFTFAFTSMQEISLLPPRRSPSSTRPILNSMRGFLGTCGRVLELADNKSLKLWTWIANYVVGSLAGLGLSVEARLKISSMLLVCLRANSCWMMKSLSSSKSLPSISMSIPLRRTFKHEDAFSSWNSSLGNFGPSLILLELFLINLIGDTSSSSYPSSISYELDDVCRVFCCLRMLVWAT